MKMLFALYVLTLSTISFAEFDACQAGWDSATEWFNRGVNQYQNANSMVDNITEHTSLEDACDILREAKLEVKSSQTSFGISAQSWTNLIGVCRGQNETLSNNQKLCLKNRSIAADTALKLDRVIRENCYGRSTPPNAESVLRLEFSPLISN
jgi:hypothetical protein